MILSQEFEKEAEGTRRLLENMPEDKLAWKPHEKSHSLGELALHIASISGPGFLKAVEMDEADITSFKPAELPSELTKDIVLAKYDESINAVKGEFMKLDEEKLMDLWKLKNEEITLMSMPKIFLLRTLMFNHIYHHRGQMTVYLRLLDAPVPPLYGPSADENPFLTKVNQA